MWEETEKSLMDVGPALNEIAELVKTVGQKLQAGREVIFSRRISFTEWDSVDVELVRWQDGRHREFVLVAKSLSDDEWLADEKIILDTRGQDDRQTEAILKAVAKFEALLNSHPYGQDDVEEADE